MNYQVSTNEQKSLENLSDGRVGGGSFTMKSKTSQNPMWDLRSCPSLVDGYGNRPNAHSTNERPRLHMSLS